MRTIYKYQIVFGKFNVWLPKDHKIIKVDYQKDMGPYFWALINQDSPQSGYTFEVLGTGQSIPNNYIYAGTWQEPPFVWHLFQEELA